MSSIFKIWGQRRRILLTNTVEIDLLYVKKNTFCSTHRHKFKSNKFTVIEGQIRIETEFGNIILKKNGSFTVNPPLKHRFFNITDGILIECAYVNKGKIDSLDIIRESQGGIVINKKEITYDELKKKGKLKL